MLQCDIFQCGGSLNWQSGWIIVRDAWDAWDAVLKLLDRVTYHILIQTNTHILTVYESKFLKSEVHNQKYLLPILILSLGVVKENMELKGQKPSIYSPEIIKWHHMQSRSRALPYLPNHVFSSPPNYGRKTFLKHCTNNSAFIIALQCDQ